MTVNFDDHDWEQLGQASSAESRQAASLWKVAAGVVAGMLIGGVLVYALDRHPAPADVTDTARGSAPWAPASEPTRAGGVPIAAPATSQPAGDAVAVDVPKTAADAAPRPNDAIPAGNAPREMEAAQRAMQVAAERRDRAWANFYQKPPQCDDNPSKATMVECANHYIRARRQFEAMYGRGRREGP